VPDQGKKRRRSQATARLFDAGQVQKMPPKAGSYSCATPKEDDGAGAVLVGYAFGLLIAAHHFHLSGGVQADVIEASPLLGQLIGVSNADDGIVYAMEDGQCGVGAGEAFVLAAHPCLPFLCGQRDLAPQQLLRLLARFC